MEEHEYKKNYLWMVLWFVLFIGGYAPVILLMPEDNETLMVRLSLFWVAVMITLLAWIVYKTEAVYYYNGTSFEDAKKAGSERRKEFALAHLKRFGYPSAIYVIFTLISYAAGWNYWIDFVIFMLVILGAAVSTIRIRL